MKYHFFLVFIQLLLTTIISVLTVDKRIHSTSSIGPFQLVFKQIFKCNLTQNNQILNDLYIDHTGNKSSLLLGNSTFEIPFDDSFFLEIKMSLKDASGTWKENVFTHKMPKACSSLKKLMGSIWPIVLNDIGIKQIDCPILPGTYVAPGFDLSLIMDTNIPKVFIYGTYKLHIFYSRRNEIFGCIVCIMEFKRP